MGVLAGAVSGGSASTTNERDPDLAAELHPSSGCGANVFIDVDPASGRDTPLEAAGSYTPKRADLSLRWVGLNEATVYRTVQGNKITAYRVLNHGSPLAPSWLVAEIASIECGDPHRLTSPP